MMKYITLLLLLLLSACAAPVGQGAIPTTEAQDLSPTPAAESSATPTPAPQTPENPSSTILVQYDEFGGMIAAAPGAHIPLRTIYDDGLVVWAQEGEPTIGFDRQVWVGRLDDESRQELIELITSSGFMDLQPEYKAPAFVSKDGDDNSPPVIAPNPQGGLDQPTGVIRVNLSGRSQQVTVYPASWDEAPAAYKSLRDYLLSLQPDDARPFVPDSFHLEITPITAQVTKQSPAWPFADIDLQNPPEITPAQAQDIHRFLSQNGDLVTWDGRIYRVNLLAAPPS